MGKHAYLIIAHNHFEQLNRLLYVLDDERNDIFLHIDKKVADSALDSITKSLQHSQVYFSERVSVSWGGYSQIESELAVLGCAVKTGHYDYYHLISGADLPVKSQDYLHQFFDEAGDKEFIQFQKPKIAAEKLSRVQRYAWFQEHDVRNNRFYSQLQRITLIIQHLLKVNRIRHAAIEFQMGSNWFSITDEFARYVMASAKDWVPYFKHTQCADELFIQTLVINSPFKDKLARREFDDSKLGNMRYIEWVNHAPRDLTMQDFEALKATPLLFARKFNPETDQAVIDQVIQQLA